MNSLTAPLQKSTQTGRLFFILSGEHASLPAAEVKAILESSGLEYSEPAQSYRMLNLNASPKALKVVSERSLMYDSCGIVLGESEAETSQILSLLKNTPIEELTRDYESFAVRSIRLGGVNRTLRRVKLESEVGSVVKQMVPRLSVRLRNPDLVFVCIIFENKFLFGMSSYSKPSGLIAPRRPRKRPVFHPSTMPPKIARCMVNLARSVPDTLFMDPFSGVGGIAIEAAVIGCRVLAADANLRMLRGARRNMNHFRLQPEGFLNADARHLPVQGLAAAATDPPYGRGSSTMGTKVAVLVREFLRDVRSSLNKGAHLCISSPMEVDIEGYAKETGFQPKEKHLARIHRSLTRQFVVLQNP